MNQDKGVESAEDALTGASDIIAEDLSDDPDIRKRLRELFHRRGSLVCKAADPDTDSVYRLYYGCADRGIGHHCRGSFRRSGYPQAPAGTVPPPGKPGVQGGRPGYGQRVPAVL